MTHNKLSRGRKVYDFFRKNPSANAAQAAAKHKISISNVYKMRARALDDLRNFVAPVMLPMPDAPGVHTVDKTLNERAEIYGTFIHEASLIQSIKRELAAHAAKHNKAFTDDQWEALEMIAHKVGRIVNGDPNIVDHWLDIAGYATLVADRLR